MQSCLTVKMLEKLQGGAENFFPNFPNINILFGLFGKAENFACQPLKSP